MTVKRLTWLPVALLVAACGLGPPEIGTVTDMEYDDPDTWTVQVADTDYRCGYEYTYDPATGKSDYKQVCRWVTVGYHDEERHDPAHWRIFLVEGDQSGWVEVTQQVYEQAELGGRYNRETRVYSPPDPDGIPQIEEVDQ